MVTGSSPVGLDETASAEEHAGGFRGGGEVAGAGTPSYAPHRAAGRTSHRGSETCGATQGDSTVDNVTVNSVVHARCLTAGTDPVADQTNTQGAAPGDLLPQRAGCSDRTPAQSPSRSSTTIDSSAGLNELPPDPKPTGPGEPAGKLSGPAPVPQRPCCSSGLPSPARDLPEDSEQKPVGTSVPPPATYLMPEVRADAPSHACCGTAPNPDLRGSGGGGKIRVYSAPPAEHPWLPWNSSSSHTRCASLPGPTRALAPHPPPTRAPRGGREKFRRFHISMSPSRTWMPRPVRSQAQRSPPKRASRGWFRRPCKSARAPRPPWNSTFRERGGGKSRI